MAVSRVGSWAAVTQGTDPSGSVTIGAGSDRILIAVVSAMKDLFNVSVFSIGGQAATGSYEEIDTTNSPDHVNYVYYWDEATIAAMSGSTISWTSDTTVGKFAFSYATFQGVDQVIPFAVQGSSYSASTDSFDVTTTSGADDYIIVSVVRSNANRDFTNWDSLTEVFDDGPVAGIRYGAADGSGGDDITTITGDGTPDDMFAHALVLASTGSSSSIDSGTGRGILRGVCRGIG